MTTLKERFNKNFGAVLPAMGVEASQISSLLSFFRQELLALAEEVAAKKEQNDPGFADIEAAKDYGKLDDLADYAETAGANAALATAASLIRSKADELV